MPAIGPGHSKLLYLLCISEPYEEAGLHAALVATAQVMLIALYARCCGDFHTGAYPLLIPCRAFKSQAKGVIAIVLPGIVAVDKGFHVDVVDDQVKITVVVEVSIGRPSRPTGDVEAPVL